MLFALGVYVTAGRVIWNNRRHLDGFLNPLNEYPFTNTITTDIEITYEERFVVKDTGSKPDVCDMNDDTDPYCVSIQAGRSGPQNHTPTRPLPAALRIRSLTRAAAESKPNTEAWLYARVAVLFFIALLITWVPSSVNRLYELVTPGAINFPLSYVSSFVFPLQGFLNAVVYIITSQRACRRLWKILWGGRRRNVARVGENLTSQSDERIWGGR